MENEIKKEIDLIDVINKILNALGRGFKKCVTAIGWVLRLAFQEKKLVCSFVLVGILLGFFVTRNSVYRAEVELRINLHDSYYYKNLIDPMFKQCKYRKMDLIASDLNLTLEDAEKIVNIQSFYYVDALSDGTPNWVDYDEKFIGNDTTDMIMNDRLRIVVDCMDTALFKRMTGCFDDYFRKNKKTVFENELRIRQLNERIKAIEVEEQLLDSLRKKEYFKDREDVQLSTDKMVLVERERKLYHNEVLSLENERQKLIWERDVFEKGISFSSDFEMNPHPVNFWLKFCAIFGFLFFVIGLIVASIKIRREKIKNYLNKSL